MLKVDKTIIICLTIIIVAALFTGNGIKVGLVFGMYFIYKIFTHA